MRSMCHYTARATRIRHLDFDIWGLTIHCQLVECANLREQQWGNDAWERMHRFEGQCTCNCTCDRDCLMERMRQESNSNPEASTIQMGLDSLHVWKWSTGWTIPLVERLMETVVEASSSMETCFVQRSCYARSLWNKHDIQIISSLVLYWWPNITVR